MIGKTISHYRILGNLYRGGMGTVYKAEDLKLQRQVALKFLPQALTPDAEARERFIQEARALSSFEHTNVCTVYDVDETEDGRIFLSMPYYEGETLKKKIEKGPLRVDEAVDIALQIARGLSKAHIKDIVHRDIKPANIVVTGDGVVRILDFGLAKLAGEAARITDPGTTLGTAAYMSPEQARGDRVDHRTDIWSLGVVLYEMLTGQLPFNGEYEQAIIYAILNEDPEPVTRIRPEVPRELEWILVKALRKNQDER